MKLLGIHHVTSLASDAQRNVDFYTGVLGLRLVKQTVNFDAPEVYHLYYGDESGRPGTLLTFFPFAGAVRGRRGTGAMSAVAFSAPMGSLGYWAQRFGRLNQAFEGPRPRFGEPVLSVEDPDGMAVELVEDPESGELPGWASGSVDPEHALRRLHGVTVLHRSLEATSRFVTASLGFTPTGSEAGRHRFLLGEGPSRSRLDVVVDPSASPARQSAGSFHHVAWRVASDAEQQRWQGTLRAAGAAPTPVMDRQYFRSIYFREPGGVLFEIATDPPGFLVDESPQLLGSSLRLPSWLEADRAGIEGRLPPLTVGTGASRS